MDGDQCGICPAVGSFASTYCHATDAFAGSPYAANNTVVLNKGGAAVSLVVMMLDSKPRGHEFNTSTGHGSLMKLQGNFVYPNFPQSTQLQTSINIVGKVPAMDYRQ